VFSHIMSLSQTGGFARPPHCEACLGPSERAYLSLFGLSTLREVVFEEVTLEQLQVEFRVEEKTPKMTGTSKNFRRNYDPEPSSWS
jgi:hypothetical protein